MAQNGDHQLVQVEERDNLAQNKIGETPLHVALFERNTSVARITTEKRRRSESGRLTWTHSSAHRNLSLLQ
ncbi:hypothetical protein TKK_0004708 [Trichogramma kaykai]